MCMLISSEPASYVADNFLRYAKLLRINISAFDCISNARSGQHAVNNKVSLIHLFGLKKR